MMWVFLFWFCAGVVALFVGLVCISFLQYWFGTLRAQAWIDTFIRNIKKLEKDEKR